MSDCLPKTAWLKVWDHCLTSGPDFLYCLVSAYFLQLRNQLLAQGTAKALATFLAAPAAVDVEQLLQTAYGLRRDTPQSLLPGKGEGVEALPRGEVYAEARCAWLLSCSGQ